MGHDVSFHPISEEQMHLWYFDMIDGGDRAAMLEQHNVDPFWLESYTEYLDSAQKPGPDDTFNGFHAFRLAAIQGYFRKFYYLRKCGFSLMNPETIAPYLKNWQDIAPNASLIDSARNDFQMTSYAGGGFIPADKVSTLLADMESNPSIKPEIDAMFPGKHRNVFVRALQDAAENGLGLMEATEIIEPNPFDLNSSPSYSNRLNCDLEGPLLYEEIALAQIAEIERSQGMQPGDISQEVTYETVVLPETEKKPSLFGRLFRRK